MSCIPCIDLGECTDCEGCISVCPEVFQVNNATGCMEVVDLPNYPVALVDEAIKNCPEDCISWDC